MSRRHLKKGKESRSPARSMLLEALPSRVLLTASFNGTADRDDIEIAVSGSNMVVTINGTSSTAPIATTTDIAIHAGGGDDRILLDSTQIPVTIFGEGGDDDVTTTQDSGNLSSMAAPITYDGGTGQDMIKMWDDLVPANVVGSYHVTANTFDRQSFAGVTFTSLENMDFRGPAGNDHILVDAAPANLPNYDLYGGPGNDTFEFGAAADSLSSLLSPIEIHGELGNDAVIIHDGANTADAVWTITNFTVGRTGWAGMRYNTSESVTIDAGSGSETFNVESTHATAPLTINAAGGNDVARLAPTSKLLDDIFTPVTFNGQVGTDQLVLFDDANTFADTYTINATSASRAFTGGANYATVEGLTLSAGSGVDTIDVTETAPGAPASIVSNAGADTVNVNADGTGAADVIFGQTENLAALNIGNGGSVKLAAGGASTLVTKSLSLAGTGKLDVTDNAVIVDYTGTSPLSAVRTALASGYAAGAWNGAGINSSTAASTPQHAVGYAEASAIFTTFPATFAGQTVDNSAVVFRYTRAGDANLDATVNLSDFNRLASSFGTGSLWSDGNFNYDSTVNLSDFNLLASSFGQSAIPSTQR